MREENRDTKSCIQNKTIQKKNKRRKLATLPSSQDFCAFLLIIKEALSLSPSCMMSSVQVNLPRFSTDEFRYARAMSPVSVMLLNRFRTIDSQVTQVCGPKPKTQALRIASEPWRRCSGLCVSQCVRTPTNVALIISWEQIGHKLVTMLNCCF